MSSERSTAQLADIARFADELPVAIWVGTVPSGDCIYVNKAFRQVLGIDPPEGAARGNYVGPYSVHTWTGEPYPDHQMPYERAVRARALIEIDDLVIHRHDGGRTYLRVYARPLFDEHGEMTHIVEGFTDITREVLSKQAEREREAQLRQAQRMESLGSLAGGIAHDFNNLLTAISMISSHLAARPTTPSDCREALAQIDEITDSAARLTRALLGFARQGKNLHHRTSMNELAGRVAELARRTVGRQISVIEERCPGPLDVEGDPAQLEQLLMNLVVNAKEAISGTGRIIVRTYTHEVAAHGADTPSKHAVIEVQDTGSGIPEELRERIFEPYFTTKTAGAVKGTGLGLATVFGIVESHRGRVEVASTSPQGTTIRVTLPLLPAAPSVRVEPSQVHVAPAAGRGTVLVIDDESRVLQLTARAIEDLGYEVLTASDGASGVDAYRQANGRIDAVVLDLVMPVMGGRETYLALRELDPDVRVVLITGYGLNHEVQELLDMGVRTFLAKPYRSSELAEALTRIAKVQAERAG